MNLDYYRVFLECISVGNLTTCAHNLGYTQSGVSHIIAYLEDEFGFPLLFRSKSGIRLTDGGERVAALMREVISKDDQLCQLAAEIAGLRSGRVRVGAIESVATQWLPELIKGFNGLYPNIEFKITVGDYKQVEDMLQNALIDCVFLSSATAKHLSFTPLMQDELVALLPHDHPLAQRDSLTLKEISSLDFIVPGEGTNYDIGQIFKRANMRLKVKTSINADRAAVAMVKAGLGVTIMPELILDGIEDAGAVVHLEPRCFRTVGIAHKSDAVISPACGAFIKFVESYIGNIGSRKV